MDIEQITKQYSRQEFMDLLVDSDYGDVVANIFNDDYSCPSDFKLVDIDIAKSLITCNQRCKECWMNAIKDVKFKDEIQEQRNEINNIKLNTELWNDILLGKGKLMCLKDEYKIFYDYIMTNKKLLKNLDDSCIHTNIIHGIDDNTYIIYTPNATDKIIYYSELFIEDKKYSASEIIHMIEEGKLNNNDSITDHEGISYTIKEIKGSLILGLVELAPYKIKKYEPKYVTFAEAVKSGKKIKYKNLMDFYNIKDLIKKIIHVYNTDTINKMLEEKAWLIEE